MTYSTILKQAILIIVVLAVAIYSANAQEHPLSKHDSALVVSYTQAYELELQNNVNFKEASRYLNEIAFIYWEHNQYEKAIEYYKESVELNEKIENENGIAMIHNNLGMLHADIMDYEKSYEYFMLTLAARRSKNEKIGMISAMINLSVVLNNLKRYDESIDFLQQSLKLAREMGDVHQMKSCYGMLSETYEKAGNVDQSIYYFNLYKTFTQMIQNEQINQVMEDYSEEKLIKQRLEIENNENRQKLVEKQAELNLIETKKNQFEQELNSYDSITRSLYADLGQKELQLELLTKQSQIEQLKAQQQINQQKAEKEEEKRKLHYALIFTLIVLIILFFLVRSKRRTKKWAISTAEKNKVIERQGNELKDLNANLQVLVEQRTKKLKLANEKLSEFIFSNSHIIRRPVANIKGIVNLLNQNGVDEKNAQLIEMLDASNNELDEALTLFNESLTLSESTLDETNHDTDS
ncbi:tetratricopeptide repeat protein [Reichenbachiella versicolor]|uniref:tetratricopeptide repeat protein n=1 Tax=Reichenbachiella versicolor TaxID=1821036 RepID=UPI000D6EA206|nr:tetratricopeptide repeat protein [Reichenbachiella versicolor]